MPCYVDLLVPFNAVPFRTSVPIFQPPPSPHNANAEDMALFGMWLGEDHVKKSIVCPTHEEMHECFGISLTPIRGKTEFSMSPADRAAYMGVVGGGGVESVTVSNAENDTFDKAIADIFGDAHGDANAIVVVDSNMKDADATAIASENSAAISDSINSRVLQRRYESALSGTCGGVDKDPDSVEEEGYLALPGRRQQPDRHREGFGTGGQGEGRFAAIMDGNDDAITVGVENMEIGGDGSSLCELDSIESVSEEGDSGGGGIMYDQDYVAAGVISGDNTLAESGRGTEEEEEEEESRSTVVRKAGVGVDFEQASGDGISVSDLENVAPESEESNGGGGGGSGGDCTMSDIDPVATSAVSGDLTRGDDDEREQEAKKARCTVAGAVEQLEALRAGIDETKAQARTLGKTLGILVAREKEGKGEEKKDGERLKEINEEERVEAEVVRDGGEGSDGAIQTSRPHTPPLDRSSERAAAVAAAAAAGAAAGAEAGAAAASLVFAASAEAEARAEAAETRALAAETSAAAEKKAAALEKKAAAEDRAEAAKIIAETKLKVKKVATAAIAVAEEAAAAKVTSEARQEAAVVDAVAKAVASMETKVEAAECAKLVAEESAINARREMESLNERHMIARQEYRREKDAYCAKQIEIQKREVRVLRRRAETVTARHEREQLSLAETMEGRVMDAEIAQEAAEAAAVKVRGELEAMTEQHLVDLKETEEGMHAMYERLMREASEVAQTRVAEVAARYEEEIHNENERFMALATQILSSGAAPANSPLEPGGEEEDRIAAVETSASASSDDTAGVDQEVRKVEFCFFYVFKEG